MLFGQATANALRTLWRVRIDPATLDWQSAERLTAGTTHDVAVTMSLDGTRLAFSRQQESTRAWALPIAASPRPRVTGEGIPLTEEGALIESPAVSPDDKFLAYHLRRPGIDRTELWVVAMNGTSRELLATSARELAWSRDNTRVAYLYVRLDRLPIDSALAYRRLGGVEQFVSPWTSDWAIHAFDWTPDGRSLLGTLQIQSRQASLVLWPTSSPKATRPERVLLQGDEKGVEGYWQGRFSPNGKWISFVAASLPDRLQLGVIPASGSVNGKWSLVAADHHWADKPRWAADGRQRAEHLRETRGAPNADGNRQHLDARRRGQVSVSAAVPAVHLQ
jgi:Tol biopolymer transport system component